MPGDEIVGQVMLGQLAEMQRRGFSPQEAVNALLAEAERRFPGSFLRIEKSTSGPYFHIVRRDL